MAHFAERDNDLPFKGFFLPITLFPKPSDNSEGQDQTCSSKCLQFCVASLLLSWYTALPSSLYLYTVIFTLPHTVKYLSIPCQSCFAFFLGDGEKWKARIYASSDFLFASSYSTERGLAG